MRDLSRRLMVGFTLGVMLLGSAGVAHAGFFVELEWAAPVTGDVGSYIVYENGIAFAVPNTTIHSIEYQTMPAVDLTFEVSAVNPIGVEGAKSNSLTISSTVWIGPDSPSLISVTPHL